MRYFVEIAYAGTNYHGWQIQPNAISVQEIIEKKLSFIFDETVKVMGCGRTDRGVHASQFYFHFDTEKDLPNRFPDVLNHQFPSDISVKRIIEVAPEAHARFDATNRTYCYQLHMNKNPFTANYSTLFGHQTLDYTKLQAAAEVIKKHEDFLTFCKGAKDYKHTRCNIKESYWERYPGEDKIDYFITANRFLRNMVRRIVGSMLLVGRGKLSVEEFDETIAKKELFNVTLLAPPQGLYLINVTYPFI